jgi:hypothetical protein
MEQKIRDWDWKKAIPSRSFYQLSIENFPNWEKPNGHNPKTVWLSIIKGLDKSSRIIAIEFDEISQGNFYYRDWTKSGLPFIDDREQYDAIFSFQFISDAEKFHELFGGIVG